MTRAIICRQGRIELRLKRRGRARKWAFWRRLALVVKKTKIHVRTRGLARNCIHLVSKPHQDLKTSWLSHREEF